MEAVRIVLAVALRLGLSLIPGDFSVAFMHTPLEEEVFIEPPREIEPDPNVIWRLKKALNGLVVASSGFQQFSHKHSGEQAWVQCFESMSPAVVP